MNTHVTDRFPDYLANALDRMQKAEVDAHIEQCALCREEFDTLLRLWARLGSLPAATPSADARARFTAMLDAYQEGVRSSGRRSSAVSDLLDQFIERFLPKSPVMRLASFAAVLLAVLLVGVRLGRPSDDEVELTRLRGEVQHIGRLLTMSLLNQSSASERLRGVSWTSSLESPDPQVIDALVEALRYDSNVNVRLASVDALGKFLGDPKIRDEVVKAIPEQSSPLVQIALVDLVFRENVTQSVPTLQKLVADPKTNAAVKKRIEEGIGQL